MDNDLDLGVRRVSVYDKMSELTWSERMKLMIMTTAVNPPPGIDVEVPTFKHDFCWS